jgi:ectoine hydroxylase-related dioxygenase (phytanoyl-CoA dioxygenase family)
MGGSDPENQTIRMVKILRSLDSTFHRIDVDEENGPMRVIPESHKLGKLEHRFYPEYNNYQSLQKYLLFCSSWCSVYLCQGKQQR